MERQTSSAAGEQSDVVTETLERLEVADNLQELRRHIDELIGELSAKERASSSDTQQFSPELEGQIENLGDKVESASNLLAELTDLLEAQTERIETIEHQLGDPDVDDHRGDERAGARPAAVPTFSMRPGRSEPPPRFEQRYEPSDPTAVLRDYLDTRLERLEAGIRAIEMRVSEIRGAAEERDRQVRELEERLLILVDSGVSREPSYRGSGRDAGRERPIRESLRERSSRDYDRGPSLLRRGAERRVRVFREQQPGVTLDPRPTFMPLFAHRSATAPRPMLKYSHRSIAHERRGYGGTGEPLDGAAWRGAGASHAPVAVTMPAVAQMAHESRPPLRVRASWSQPAPSFGTQSPPAERRAWEPAPRMLEPARPEPPLSGRTNAERPSAPAISVEATPERAPAPIDLQATAEHQSAPPAQAPRPESMRELERLVERDIQLHRDFGASAAETVRPSKAHPVVLVVDDAPDALRLLSIYLSKTGYQVVTATSAEDCLAKLRHHDIDAVVLDAKMPGASGAHVCRVLRDDPVFAARRHVPVIVYTGYPDEFSSDVRTQWGAADYVVKGGDMLPLITALVRHTTKRS